MSDFAQSGLISTLQALNPAHLPEIERELESLARSRPIALILPCHGTDLERPALGHIVNELHGAAFIGEILVSLNGLGAEGLERARAVFEGLPQRVRFLWNDGPLPGGLAGGKGFNVWSAIGVLCAEERAAIIALQDCDVASFRRGTLARLCYACAHPQLGYAFAKMYYSRATDRLYGRVSRLFFAPLLHAIVRQNGHLPLVDFLLSFRYPLAGECALQREVAACLPLSGGWGLETGMLCELFRHVDPRQVCQVDGGSGYDHKHQPAAGALAAMSAEIARTLFAQLAREGLSIDAPFLAAIASAYRREASLAVRRSANLALINGLPFDESSEAAIVEQFAAHLHAAAPGAHSRELPAWNSVTRAGPGLINEIGARLFER